MRSTLLHSVLRQLRSREFSTAAWAQHGQHETARRVVATGLGLVTPLGVGVDHVWPKLLAGETGVRGLTRDDLPSQHAALIDELPSRVVACVPKDAFDRSEIKVSSDAARMGKFVSYAAHAAAEALLDAEWAPLRDEDQYGTGVAIGTGMSSTNDICEAAALLASGKLRKLSPYFVPKILPNMAAGMVSMQHGFRGPLHTVSTACATGLHAVGDAYEMILSGKATVMVAGGTESCVDAVSLGGFGRMKALSTRFNDNPTEASRPFDKLRDGFVLGEGAGVLVLEEMSHAVSRGAHIYGEICGYGLSGDAHHITQPDPQTRGAQHAMRMALFRAGMVPEDVGYVNAHATSTPRGDDLEQLTIAAVLGDRAEHSSAKSVSGKPGVWVSSTKGATGHLLGAAGAVEAVFTILSLKHGLVPPNVNLSTPDGPALPGLVQGTAQQLHDGNRAALCNSFGFGGTNACIAFRNIQC